MLVAEGGAGGAFFVAPGICGAAFGSVFAETFGGAGGAFDARRSNGGAGSLPAICFLGGPGFCSIPAMTSRIPTRFAGSAY